MSCHTRGQQIRLTRARPYPRALTRCKRSKKRWTAHLAFSWPRIRCTSTRVSYKGTILSECSKPSGPDLGDISTITTEPSDPLRLGLCSVKTLKSLFQHISTEQHICLGRRLQSPKFRCSDDPFPRRDNSGTLHTPLKSSQKGTNVKRLATARNPRHILVCLIAWTRIVNVMRFHELSCQVRTRGLGWDCWCL
jgi:hypothetical protein